MRRSLPFLGLFFVISVCSQAQTDPLYAQYLNNPLLINPAYSGLNNHFTAAASYRKQWAGFDGSPTTFNVNAHTSLLDNRMGAGLMVVKDQAGANSNTEVHATYAYKLDLKDKYLSFGLQAGVVNFRSDNGDLNPFDDGDPLFSGNLNTTKPSFGAGAILHSDRYFVGVSVPRLLKATEEYSTASNGAFEKEQVTLYNRHLYIMGAYVIFLNEHIRLKPSVLLKDVKGSKLSADVNFAANLNEKYTAGAFTRNFNTYGLLVQMKLGDQYRFGYVFEVPTNNSVGARFTSHELTFGINLAVLRSHDALAVTNF